MGAGSRRRLYDPCSPVGPQGRAGTGRGCTPDTGDPLTPLPGSQAWGRDPGSSPRPLRISGLRPAGPSRAWARVRGGPEEWLPDKAQVPPGRTATSLTPPPPRRSRWPGTPRRSSAATSFTAISRNRRPRGRLRLLTQRWSPCTQNLAAPWGRWAASSPSSGMTSTGAMMRSSRPCCSTCSQQQTTPMSTSPRSRPACLRAVSTGAAWWLCWALATAWPSTSTSAA